MECHCCVVCHHRVSADNLASTTEGFEKATPAEKMDLREAMLVGTQQSFGEAHDTIVAPAPSHQEPTFEDWPIHVESIPDANINDTVSEIMRTPQSNVSYTYNFQETTFARRLHRMCLERAFRQLTNPGIDPNHVGRIFRFTFCFSDRKRLVHRIQELLRRRAGDSLENWNVPYFRIGGAGTHFPVRDDSGRPIYPPNMVPAAKVFGPLPATEVETPRWESSTQELLEAIGFGGEWFDSHDVEEYLKTKGIYLDGQSSFVEINPVRLDLPTLAKSASTASSCSGPTAAPTSDHITQDMDDPFMGNSLDETISSSESLLALDSTNSDQPGSSWEWAVPAPPEYTATFQDILSRRQRPVTFDVEQFLQSIVHTGACLGRAPGFRKKYIDEALALSLQEAY